MDRREANQEPNSDPEAGESEVTEEQKAALEVIKKDGVPSNSSEKEETKSSPFPSLNDPTIPAKYRYYQQNFYTVDPKVGLVYHADEAIGNQRRLVFTILKQIGTNFFSGKSVMDVSFPMTVFEPFTTLERVADLCVYMDPMLLPIAELEDPLERMRRFMAWIVASLHLGLSQQKPFNACLGETMQAKLGGLTLCAENCGERRPVSLMATGKDFRMAGDYIIKAFTYPNSVTVKTTDTRTFEIGGKIRSVYTMTQPDVKLSGIMMGKRVFSYAGEINVADGANKLYGQIRMNPYKKGFFAGLFSKQAHRDDHIKGFITRDEKLLKQKGTKVFESKAIVSGCEGNWIDNFAFDGKIYWEMDSVPATTVVRGESLLPSDTCFRADVKALKEGRPEEAQRLKAAVDEAEKRDEKLKKAAAKLAQKAREKARKVKKSS